MKYKVITEEASHAFEVAVNRAVEDGWLLNNDTFSTTWNAMRCQVVYSILLQREGE